MYESLPFDLEATGLSDVVSCDGQIYFVCSHCDRESRVHYRYIADPASWPGANCARCGAALENMRVHLYHCACGCQDCGCQFEVETAGFETISCAKCGSATVEISASEIKPPFPETFDQLAPPKRSPWGLVLEEDLEHMRAELDLSRHGLDFAAHLLLNERFCERLEIANSYEPETVGIALPNERANLWLEHCRLTSSMESGLHALTLFEQLAAISKSANAAHYVIALASHVLLVRFSELELQQAGCADVRARAVDHARLALAAAQESADSPDAILDIAKIEILLALLLSVGNAGPDEKREAIAVSDRALGRDVLSPEGADDVRINRALCISDLPDADARQMQEAIDTLRSHTVLRPKDFSDRRTNNLFNLAVLYWRCNRFDDALRAFEESAEMARRQLVRAPSPDLMAKMGGKYAVIFDRWATLLAQAGKGREALAAFEMLRGVVPRLAQDQQLRTQAAVRSAIAMLRDLAAPDDSADENEELAAIPDIASDLGRLRGPLLDLDTVLIYYGWALGQITALLVYPRSDGEIHVEPMHWKSTLFSKTGQLTTDPPGDLPRVPDLFNAIVHLDSPSTRCQWLEAAAQQAYIQLFAPIEERIRALSAKRLVFCAAGLLTSICFEAISDSSQAGRVLADDYRILYVPSIGIVGNIARIPRPGGSATLLVVGYSGSDLPGVDIEVDAIRAAWKGQCRVVRGEELTKRLVLDELATGYDYIHFAGHGTFDHEHPLDSAFYFSTRSDEGIDDAYRLTAADLLEVNLSKHPVVSISACSSGITSYDETHRMIGLAGSLFQAGARAIIGSRWPVADRVALDVMAATYASIAKGATPFEAFSKTQDALRKVYPIDGWASFSYVGMP